MIQVIMGPIIEVFIVIQVITTLKFTYHLVNLRAAAVVVIKKTCENKYFGLAINPFNRWVADKMADGGRLTVVGTLMT